MPAEFGVSESLGRIGCGSCNEYQFLAYMFYIRIPFSAVRYRLPSYVSELSAEPSDIPRIIAQSVDLKPLDYNCWCDILNEANLLR